MGNDDFNIAFVIVLALLSFILSRLTYYNLSCKHFCLLVQVSSSAQLYESSLATSQKVDVDVLYPNMFTTHEVNHRVLHLF